MISLQVLNTYKVWCARFWKLLTCSGYELKTWSLGYLYLIVYKIPSNISQELVERSSLISISYSLIEGLIKEQLVEIFD